MLGNNQPFDKGFFLPDIVSLSRANCTSLLTIFIVELRLMEQHLEHVCIINERENVPSCRLSLKSSLLGKDTYCLCPPFIDQSKSCDHY